MTSNSYGISGTLLITHSDYESVDPGVPADYETLEINEDGTIGNWFGKVQKQRKTYLKKCISIEKSANKWLELTPKMYNMIGGEAECLSAKSANTVLKNKEQYGVNRCIKLSANNVGQEGEKLTTPYYMVFVLK